MGNQLQGTTPGLALKSSNLSAFRVLPRILLPALSRTIQLLPVPFALAVSGSQCIPIQRLVKHYNPGRISFPSATKRRIYKLMIIKLIRLMLTFSKPPTPMVRTTRTINENQGQYWSTWVEKQSKGLRCDGGQTEMWVGGVHLSV